MEAPDETYAGNKHTHTLHDIDVSSNRTYSYKCSHYLDECEEDPWLNITPEGDVYNLTLKRFFLGCVC